MLYNRFRRADLEKYFQIASDWEVIVDAYNTLCESLPGEAKEINKLMIATEESVLLTIEPEEEAALAGEQAEDHTPQLRLGLIQKHPWVPNRSLWQPADFQEAGQ